MQLVSKASRTICKRCSKTKFNVASLRKSYTDKKLSLDDMLGAVRRYYMRQDVKFNNSETSKGYVSRNAIINGVKNVIRNGGSVAPVEECPRSYAEMIADYNEARCKRFAVSSERASTSYSNDTVRKSPFSALSPPYLARKIINIGDNGKTLSSPARGECTLPFSDGTRERELHGRYTQHGNTSERRDFQHHVKRTAEIASKSDNRIVAADSKGEDRSYAKLANDCRKSNTSLASDGSAPRRNALARNFLESFATATRKVSGANAQDVSRKTNSTVAAMPLEKLPQKHRYSQSGNTANFSGSTKTSDTSVERSSSRIKAGDDIEALKRSQIELRMVPSEKESIVSIDVDSSSAGGRPSDPLNPAAKQISVVVRSDQKRYLQLTDDQRNDATTRSTESTLQHNDFRPMRISISEDSAPVKQIEFSINGKPVSKLKSVTARTERLDVVSSMDKIEIRIPYDKSDAQASEIREGDLARSADSAAGQILNVQISANFQDLPAPGRGSAERSHKAELANTIPLTLPSQTHKTHLFGDSAMVSEAFSGDNDTRRYSSFIESDNITGTSVNGHKARDDVSLQIQEQSETAWKALTGKTISSIEKRSEVGRPKAKTVINTTRAPRVKYDKGESSDSRCPSSMIPWWSSSDCYNNIRKKKENCISIAPSNSSERMSSNSRQDLLGESSSSKSKEASSSSKILVKPLRSINNAIDINNSSNIFSRSNSLEQGGETEPAAHYLSLFRLKRDNENFATISEIMRNDLKSENRQTLVASKNNENLSEVSREDKPKYLLKKTKSIDDVTVKSKVDNILYVLKPIEKKKDDILVDYSSKMSLRKQTVRLNRELKIIQSSLAIATKANKLISEKSTTQTKAERIDKMTSVKGAESEVAKKIGVKTDIFNEKGGQIAKNTATSKQVHKNDDETSGLSNFRNSSKLMQMNKKQEKSADEDATILQDNSRKRLKSSSKFNENEPPCNLSSTKISSEITAITGSQMQQSENSKISVKVLSGKSMQQDKLKILSKKISGTETSKSDQFSSLESSKKEPYLPEIFKDKKMIDRKKPLLENINEKHAKSTDTNKLSSSQTKIFDTAPKVKNDPTIFKNAADKDVTVIHKSIDKRAKNADVEDTTVKKIVQNSTKNNLLSKENREENRLSKLKLDKDTEKSSGSTASPAKPNNSVESKSASTRAKSTVKSNDLLLTESLYTNFSREENTLSSSKSQIVFEASQNLNNHTSGVTGCVGLWADIDRPEKNVLYSAWLQKFRNDLNEELF